MFLARITCDGIEPEESRPPAENVIKGDPVFTSWNVDETGNLCAGVWKCTPGLWKIVYDDWEYIRIIEGHSIITDEEGNATHLRAGDSYVIRPGFKGTWEVVQTTLKDYVLMSA